jgi:hypothetical protein
MIGYENYFPRREISPSAEVTCLIIAGVLVVPVVFGFGIVKLSEWIKEGIWGGRGERTWIMKGSIGW